MAVSTYPAGSAQQLASVGLGGLYGAGSTGVVSFTIHVSQIAGGHGKTFTVYVLEAPYGGDLSGALASGVPPALAHDVSTGDEVLTGSLGFTLDTTTDTIYLVVVPNYTATDWYSDGTSSLHLDSFSGVAAPFVADFDGDPRSSDTVPLSVAFTDESHDGTGTPNAWAWDFGDGTSSTSQNPTHVYAAPGSYTVSLTVTTDDAESDTLVRADYIVIGVVHVDPPPSNAVVEIYAAAVGASRWGVALWGVGVWSAAGWQDVTPQSVDARIRWGAHQPAKGVLLETEAATWIVDTYDPERLLDPGNLEGPYATDLRAGLPIRVRHRGTIVRQGVAESIAYFHAGKRGGIRVTDGISLMSRTPVPGDSDLADTLRARARDAIAAAGLSVTVEDDPPAGDPALAPRLTGDRSVWRHIADAALQTLNVAYVDRIGTLKFRPWAAPYDRGRGVDATQLVDLGTIVQTTGLYSVVSALQTVGDGGLTIERRLTPVPRYGAVAYRRTDATPDADAWAAAVLADRSLQTVQWIPGEIFPLDANAVEYFATLEAVERFGVDDAPADPPVDVTGIIVGGTVSVVGKRGAEATWSFELELAQTAQSPLYTDTDPPEFLRNDPGDGYLYGD